MKTTKHYHVIENTPGYLPDDDQPFVTRSLKEARDHAQSLADEYRQDWDHHYKVTGNKRDGYTIEDPEKTYDLGRVIEISECYEEECLEDIED